MAAGAHLLPDYDGDRLSFRSKNQLRAPRVKQMQLVRAAAHGRIILLNEEPSDLILGYIIFLLVRGGVGGSSRLCLLETRGIVDRCLNGIIRIDIRLWYRVVTVDRSLGGGSHVDSMDG